MSLIKSIWCAVLFPVGGLALQYVGVEHNAYFAFYGATFMMMFNLFTNYKTKGE